MPTVQDNVDFPSFRETFIGIGALPTSLTAGCPWKITDTSPSGAPTAAPLSPAPTGAVKLTLASTSEIENLCLDFGDILAFGVANLKWVEFRLLVSGITSGTTLTFGVQSARNDNTDSTTTNAQFKIGADGTSNVTVETDDNTTDLNQKATGQTLSTSYRKFRIDFSNLANVKFFIDNKRVASSTTFDMSAATGSVQPFVQLQKTATTAVDAVTIDDITVQLKAS